MKIEIPSHLSDDELVSQLKSLARGEREATARLIAHLAELDARGLYRAARLLFPLHLLLRGPSSVRAGGLQPH